MLKATLTIKDVMIEANISRQSVYNEIKKKRLITFNIGRRRLVRRERFQEWLVELESQELRMCDVAANRV